MADVQQQQPQDNNDFLAKLKKFVPGTGVDSTSGAGQQPPAPKPGDLQAAVAEPGQPKPPIQYSGSGAQAGPPAPPLDVDFSKGEYRPTPTGKGPDDGTTGVSKDFTQKLTQLESGGDPASVNKDTGAVGKYQFVPSQWDGYFKKKLGVTTKDMLPKDNSPEELKRASDLQDKAFQLYMHDQVVPGVEQLRRSGLGKQYDDDQLAYLIHHEGMNAAQSELQSGKFPGPTKENPQSMDQLLAQMKGGKFGVPRAGAPSTDVASTPANAPGGKYANLIDQIGGDTAGEVDQAAHSTDPNVKQTAYDLKSALASSDSTDWASELEKIRGDFQNTKDTIAKRELAHTIADALTKMAAGKIGLDTKTDMSHIDTGTHDFQKDTALAQNEYKTNLDDLKGRREENEKAKEAAADMLFKQGQTTNEATRNKLDRDKLNQDAAYKRVELTIAADKAVHESGYQDAMTQYHLDAIDANKEAKAEDRDRKMTEAHDRLIKGMSDSLGKLAANKEMVKDPDQFATAATTMLAPLRIPPAEIHQAMYESGFFQKHLGFGGDNAKSPEDVAAAFNGLIQKYGERPQSYTVTYRKPDGGTGSHSFTDRASAEKFKDQVTQLKGTVING